MKNITSIKTITIKTRFVQATETSGEKIRAIAYNRHGEYVKSFNMAYDYSLEGYENHYKAANILAKKLGSWIETEAVRLNQYRQGILSWDEARELSRKLTKSGRGYIWKI